MAAVVLMVVAAFPIAHFIADAAGDQMHFMQNIIPLLLGYTLAFESKELTPPGVSFIASAVDDCVEDSFKLVCVGSHALLANVLRQKLVPSLAIAIGASENSVPAKFAGVLIGYGGPASMYSRCDVYADGLGDAVQKFLQKNKQAGGCRK
jgi:hypothetical protein